MPTLQELKDAVNKAAIAKQNAQKLYDDKYDEVKVYYTLSQTNCTVGEISNTTLGEYIDATQIVTPICSDSVGKYNNFLKESKNLLSNISVANNNLFLAQKALNDFIAANEIAEDVKEEKTKKYWTIGIIVTSIVLVLTGVFLFIKKK